MPGPAAPLVLAFLAVKGVGGYLLYKNRDKLPDTGHWRDQMRDVLRGESKPTAKDEVSDDNDTHAPPEL